MEIELWMIDVLVSIFFGYSVINLEEWFIGSNKLVNVLFDSFFCFSIVECLFVFYLVLRDRLDVYFIIWFYIDLLFSYCNLSICIVIEYNV